MSRTDNPAIWLKWRRNHPCISLDFLPFCSPSRSWPPKHRWLRLHRPLHQQIVLWDAVIADDVTTAIAAIKAGADVNGLDTRANIAGPNGRRPLNYAAIRNDTAMITTLLNAGANINLANRSGFTPLHHAGEAGSKEAATLLIQSHAEQHA